MTSKIKTAESKLESLNREILLVEQALERKQAACTQVEKRIDEMRAEETKLYDAKRRTEVDLEALQAKMRTEQDKLRVADALTVLMSAFYDVGYAAMRRRHGGF